MLIRVLQFSFLLSLGYGLVNGAAFGEESKFKIKVTVKVSGSETKQTYTIVPEKKYLLSLSKADKGRSKISLYDQKGNKKEGLYWIDNKDLAKIMSKPIGDIVKLVENRPAAKPPKNCANCGTDDAQDRTEATAEPKNEEKPKLDAKVKADPNTKSDVKPANKPIQVADLPVPAPGDLCGMFENFKKKGVPEAPLKQAMAYFNENKKKFSNDRYISIADYSQRSDKKRFYLLDLKTGSLVNEKVSHGSGKVGGSAGSDPNNDGLVDRCEHPNRLLAAAKNPRRHVRTRENMTRPGFFSTGGLNLSQAHRRKWPRVTKGMNSMILNGLSGRVNSTARDDGVLMHEAYYNFNGNQKMGRSFGCPAFVPGHGAPIMRNIKGGSLYYSYVPVCKGDMEYVLKDVDDWKTFCSDK